MHAASKMNTVLILSYWICSTILLAKGKKYPCVLEGQVPDEEFGSNHYGELGYLRNVIVDVAQFMHKQMKLETPLRLCKLLSEVKTSYWDYFHITWKKKTRDKYGTEFSILEKKAERVLTDLIKNARLTPAYPIADQEALAKVIDLAKDRLLKSKIYTNEDSLLMNNLNKLRGIYCPRIPRSSSEAVKSATSQSNHGSDKLAKPPPLISTKSTPVEPSTTENLVIQHPATPNVPSKSSLITSAVLPSPPLPLPKDQHKPELDGNGAPKAPVPPSLPKPPTSSEPSPDNGQVGSPKPPLSDWTKPMTQTNKAIPEIAHKTPPTSHASGHKCSATGKACRPVWVDRDGNIIESAASGSHNNHEHGGQPQAVSGDSVQQYAKGPKPPDFTPMSSSNLIYELEHVSEFKPKVLLADKPVIVQFTADFCKPCKAMAPTLEDIVKEKKGEVYLVRIDTDKLFELTDKLDVKTLPHIKVFHNGRKIYEKTGYFDPTDLRKWAQDTLPSPPKS